MELLLIRHALPVRKEGVEGPADPVLAADGHRQAALLAAYLADEPLDAVYASPLLRARQTAEPVAKVQDLPLIIDDGVAEYDRLHNEYVPIEELKAANDPRWQAILAGDLGVPDLDPFEFRSNVVRAVEAIIERHPGRTKIAVVCHGGVINAYVSHMLGLPDPTGFFYPNYTSIHRVAAARSGERSVLAINETAHLRGTGLPIGIFNG